MTRPPPRDNVFPSTTGFKIERSADGGTTWSALVSNTASPATTYSDTGLTHTTTYTYRVSAINSIGTGSPSSTASATTLAVAPSSPTGLAATAVASSQISLSWTAPADNGGSAVTGYKIERTTDGGTTWSILVANTGSTATTYSDTGLAHTTTYTYRVSAINSVGTGSASNSASATTLAVAPSSPTGLAATAVSSSQISLSWSVPADNGGSPLTGYKVERSTDGGTTWTILVANTGSAATAYSDTGLTHTTTYTYRVSAINSVGTSSTSSTAPATTLAVAPSTPTGLTATTVSASQISLSWSAPADNGGSAISVYNFEWSTAAATAFSTLSPNDALPISAYSDTGLTHATTYTYRVSAINSVGTSSPSSTASATTLAVAPSTPTGLTATTVSSSQISLSWTAPNNGGSAITGDKIERSTDGGTTWSTLVANTGSSAAGYSDTGLVHTTTYTYRVSAINSVGTSSTSSMASATTLAAAPSSPTGVTATTVSSSQVNLSWTAPSDNGGSAITGYMIERSADGGSTWSKLVANTGITGTTYSDIGLAHGATYTYRVSAINSIGTGSPSSTASATTLAVTASPLNGLSATTVSSSQINLSWAPPSDNGGSAITGYKIERSGDGGTSWSTLVANTGGTTTTYTDTGLAHGTTYTYRVSSINSVGTSTSSSITSATTLAVVPSSPTGLAATAVSSSQIGLTWT